MKRIAQGLKAMGLMGVRAGVLAALLVAMLGVAYAWSGPLQTPPNCTSGNPGCDAPLNISNNAQTKSGSITTSGGFFQSHFGLYLDSVNPAITTNDLYNTGGTLYWNGSPVLTGSSATWTVSGANIYNANTGNVGIGTQSPVAPLQVNAPASNTKKTVLYVQNSAPVSTVNTQSARLAFLPDSHFIGGAEFLGPYIEAVTDNITTSESSLRFGTYNGASVTAEKMIIKGNGNVGIGTANPTHKLDVALGSNEIAALNDGANASGFWGTNIGLLSQNSTAQITTNGSVPLAFYTGGTLNSMTAGSERMRIDTSGNVGIGTANPASLLSVAGKGYFAGGLGIGAVAPANQLFVKQSSDNFGQDGYGLKIERNGNDSNLLLGYRSNTDAWQIAASYNANGAFKPLTFLTSDAERMRIDTSGNVGIGTANPAQKLDVNGSLHVSGDADFAGSAFLTLGGTNSWGFHTPDDGRTILYFGSGTNEAGWSFPISFDRDGSAVFSGNLTVGGTATVGGQPVCTKAGGANCPTGTTPTLQTVTNAGNTTTQDITANKVFANNWLRTYGQTGWFSETYCGGWMMQDSTWIRSYCGKSVYMDNGFDTGGPAGINCAGGIGGGYNLHVCGTVAANAYYYSSDERLKTNIAPLRDSLTKVLALQGVTFNWRDPLRGQGTQLGFIAQDVEKVVPELVATDASSTLKSVDYAKMTALLVEAVKDQQKEIDDLKAQINELTSRP